MPALVVAPGEPQCSVREGDQQGPRPPGFWWLAWPALALLTGYVLFCHGCHGDEDTELIVNADFVQEAQGQAHGR